MKAVAKRSGCLDFKSDEKSLSRFTIRLVRICCWAIALFGANALSSTAMAVGLGEFHMQSGLGQPLKLEIALVGSDAGTAENHCFKAKLLSLDGAPLGTVNIGLKNEGAKSFLTLATSRPIKEPVADLGVEYNCNTLTRREYQILLDLPGISPPVIESSRAPTPDAADMQQNVAPPQSAIQESGAEPSARSSKRHGRHRHSSESAIAGENIPSPAVAHLEPHEKHAKKERSKELRSVLRLGGDDAVDVNLNSTEGVHLALSRSLSVSPMPPEEKPAASTAVQNPIQQPAQGAGGNDVPGQTVDAELLQLQAKIRVLEAETQELRKLNATPVPASEVARQAGETGGALPYLYALLGLCFVAICWLIWRTRQIQSDIAHTSWHQIVPDREEAEEQDEAEEAVSEDDLDSDDESYLESKNVTRLRQVYSAAVAEEPEIAPKAAPQNQNPAVKSDETPEGDYKFYSNARSTLPNAEEILDEIQQAEFWMEMQQPERAIEILESNWGMERPSSPLPWLYLFDLYRTVGDEKKYLELTERFEQIFNGKVIPWGDGKAVEHSRSLEEFPFLLAKICEMWPSEELVPYLENLLIDDRDGRRQGFDLAAYRDILFLTNIAYEIKSPKSQAMPALKIPEWSAVK